MPEIDRGRSGPRWSRRDFLGAMAAAPGAALAAGAAGAPRRVGIIGGGMAGVSLAWLLDGHREVHLFEARETLGGNVRAFEVDGPDGPVVVDMGAQYFHPGPYPTYVELLTQFDLYSPSPDVASASHSFPASITVSDVGARVPSFVSPLFPDRSWPLFELWNLDGLWAFGLVLWAASLLDAFNVDYGLTMDDWLKMLPLSTHQRDDVILPWTASLYSGSVEQARGYSARAAMVFVSRAQPSDLGEAVAYFVLDPGMGEVLRRMVSQCSTVSFRTNAPVQRLSRGQDGGFVVQTGDGLTTHVDDLVLASSAPASRELLQGVSQTRAQQNYLGGVGYHDARLALHRDPAYATADPHYWSFLNCESNGAFCEASMWMAPVLRDLPVSISSTLWKSWITHRAQPPQQVLYETSYRHMLPTPATIQAQNGLLQLQGLGDVWFAGGYTRPYDSQETALRSAMDVAWGMQVDSERLLNLL